MDNPNLKRRSGLGLWARVAAPWLKPWLRLLRRNASSEPSSLTVFQSYLVGDLFMALPALKLLARERDIRVLCRPDCVEILREEGLQGIAFENVFFTDPSPASFLQTLRSAWKLRGGLGSIGPIGSLGSLAFDFDADPRTAFWLKIAGVPRVISYSRPYAVLFDNLFDIPINAVHQADKNLAVVSGFLEWQNKLTPNKNSAVFSKASSEKERPFPSFPPLVLTSASSSWILSCWTRKDTKNWPLEKWDPFLERLLEAQVVFRVLIAPDGDAAFRAFQKRWTGRVEFLKGSLPEIAKEVRTSAGIVATDNFIGHMASYYGKPLLWINGSSDPRQVMPKEAAGSNGAPLNRPQVHSVQVDPMDCRPCGHRCINPEYKACLTHLSVDEVWTAFTQLVQATSTDSMDFTDSANSTDSKD